MQSGDAVMLLVFIVAAAVSTVVFDIADSRR